jgi:hypothetical protein
MGPSSPAGGRISTGTLPVVTGVIGPERVLTVPNLLSVLRLAGVPLFLWLLLGPHADGWAILVLAVGGSPTGRTASWPGCWTSTRGSASSSTPPSTGSTSSRR